MLEYINGPYLIMLNLNIAIIYIFLKSIRNAILYLERMPLENSKGISYS